MPPHFWGIRNNSVLAIVSNTYVCKKNMITDNSNKQTTHIYPKIVKFLPIMYGETVGLGSKRFG